MSTNEDQQAALLDHLVIASPCSISWDSMSGDDRSRKCGGCSRVVYNISDMTKPEAENFLREKGTSECMKFHRRFDGTIMTDDCPVGLRKIRNSYKFLARALAGLISMIVGFPTSVGAQQNDQVQTAQESNSNVNGKIESDACDSSPLVIRKKKLKEQARAKESRPHIFLGATAIGTMVGNRTSPAFGTFMGATAGIAISPTRGTSRSSLTAKAQALLPNQTGPTDPASTLRAEIYLDKTVRSLESKAVDARSAGANTLARFYYKAALKAFDTSKIPGDPIYRQHIEDSLKSLK